MASQPKVMEIEQQGIDTISDRDRTSTPKDLFRITFGGANTFATIILGTFPILLGLSFWQAVAATLLGVVIGASILMPMSLFGPVTGTNNAVSSGAHFGVKGRLVGSFLSLLTAIAFYSISVWVSGDALLGAISRFFGVDTSSALFRGLIYAIIGALVIMVVIYGYQFMLLVNKTVVYANTILMLAGIIAFGSLFSASYNPGPAAYALGSFWPTFILSALIVMGNPISFGAFLGDWARYIPAKTSRKSLMGWVFSAQLMTLVPFLFGVATTTLVKDPAAYIVGLVEISPAWYALPLIVIAFLGGLSTGVTSLYGTGLDFSSVFPKLSRVQSSIFIGSIAFIFILVGRLVTDLLASINAFIGLIVIFTTPWMIIMMIGFFVRRGWYSPEDVQVFNKGKTGGIYWFNAGFNWRGLLAWIPSAILGLMFCYYPPLLIGPWSGAVGGIDISLPVSIVSAAVLYVLFLSIWPEPKSAYGPKGSRLVRTK